MEKTYKGTNGDLILTDRGVIIKRGAKGFFLGGGTLRGDKTIPYSAISAVQFKKAGFTAGYIQLSLTGGFEAKGGLMQSINDENSITFNSVKNSERFAEAKKEIEEHIHKPRNEGVFKSDADDLEKYAKLRDKGVITEEEYQAMKKKLLDL